MTNPSQPPTDEGASQQRREVKRNMEKATRDQPGEFKDKSNEEKIVHIPSDKTDDPIKGLDP